MLKSIPKSSISKRKFQVYKLWNTTQDDFSPQSGSIDASIYSESRALYHSVRAKYYSNDGNVINLFGSSRNPALISNERKLSNTIYVIDIDRNKLGERLKAKSIKLTDNLGDEFKDDTFGQLINKNPTYRLISFDIQTDILTIQDEDGIQYEITVSGGNLMDGSMTLILNGDIDTFYLVTFDFNRSFVKFEKQLKFEGVDDITQLSYGNIFYQDGLIVITDSGEVDLSTYNLQYRSTQTIYETEILLSVKAGEFNYSQNPSAIDVTLSGSYDFTTTPIHNVSSAKTVKIKEILDITRKNEFSGSIGTSVGTWDDYYNSGSIDPTGSYLAPYITTIGLYDDNGDMVATAKLPRPMKNLPDYDLNFLIRFDT